MKNLIALTIIGLTACTSIAPKQNNSAVWPVQPSQLSPQHWISAAAKSSTLKLSAENIKALNEKMVLSESPLIDLNEFPTTLSRNSVEATIERATQRASIPLYDHDGVRITAEQLTAIEQNSNLESMPENITVQFALVTKRCDLKAFPTDVTAFKTADDKDIDRFQESNLFPGNAVAVLHTSADKQWYFVQSHNYRAWVASKSIAIGERDDVLQYASSTPFIVITGAKVKTVFTEENPRVSELQLDMGTRVPLVLPKSDVVNGQGSQVHYEIKLPVRDENGELHFSSALVAKSQDISEHYLPYTAANIISQSFKFLGERYGWGHRYNGRDCSGFVSDVYRSMGIFLPRNTGEQARNQSLQTTTFSSNDDLTTRLKWLKQTQIGDLIFIPGHVMMVIGHENNEIYVIHDTTGVALKNQSDELKSVKLNGVYVTPLLSLMSNANTPTIMNITAIQRIMPKEITP